MKTMTLLAAMVVLGAGCGDDDGADDDGTDAGASASDAAPAGDAAMSSLDDLCAESGGLYVRYFGKAFECHPELAFLFGRTPSAAELHTACLAGVEPFLADGTELLGDTDAVADCATYLDSLTCAKLDFGEPSPCDGIILGTVPADGTCDQDDQCAGDARCDKSGGTTCGACKAKRANDLSCNDASECSSGRCNAIGECAELVAMGGHCDAAGDCAGALVCDAAGKCNPEPSWAVGTPCAELGQLACDLLDATLYCAPDMTPGAGTCQAFLALDETCGAATNLCNLVHGETCQNSANGPVCTAPALIAAGGECNLFAGKKCDAGLQCRDHDNAGATPDQCVALVAAGGACGGDVCDVLLNCIGGMCQYGDYTGMCPGP